MGKSPEFTRREFGKISLLALTALGLRACRVKSLENIAIPKKDLEATTQITESFDWGIFTGKDLEDIEKIENTIGVKTDYITEFVAWENEGLIPQETLEYAKDNNKKIIAFWEAYEPGKIASEDSKYSCKNIINGKYDKYIKRFSSHLKIKSNEVIIFPFPEPNGDWTPQSLTMNGNEGKFIDTYRHVSTFFTDIPNVRLGLALNNQSVPDQADNVMDNYFPGKRWLNLVGIDGFNFGPPNEEWRSFKDIFTPALENAKRWNIDILISSFGCAPGNSRVSWFYDAFKVIKSDTYPIIGANIFAENKAGMGDYERDWSLDNNTLKLLAGLVE
jgi:hypothetical protein